MARAFGRLAAAAAAGSGETEAGEAEAAVGRAMRRHPEMVAGEDRDVTELMRLVPGLLAKDGFEGVQLVGLPDGRALAVKVSDGGDRARMPVTVRARPRSTSTPPPWRALPLPLCWAAAGPSGCCRPPISSLTPSSPTPPKNL